jgi:hypothetical protein
VTDIMQYAAQGWRKHYCFQTLIVQYVSEQAHQGVRTALRRLAVYEVAAAVCMYMYAMFVPHTTSHHWCLDRLFVSRVV